MIQTFIVCHDPRVIDYYESVNHFNALKDYKYVLVGNAEYVESEKVIIARNLPINIEERKNLLVYTAWYALIKNNLITGKFVRLLEYDTVVKPDIEQRSVDMVWHRAPFIGIWGHFPYHIDNYHFINNPEWVEGLDKALKQVYDTTSSDLVTKHKMNGKSMPFWMGTSNILFKKEELESFINWYEPISEIVYEDPKAGHGLERALTLYCYHQEKAYHFISEVVYHHQLNSHGTQQAGSYEENIKKIIPPHNGNSR